MEFIISGGYYLACLAAGLIPPAIWWIGRRKYRSPLWPVSLLHLALFAWFLLARHDRFGERGYGSHVQLFLFTPYFAACALSLIWLAVASLRQPASRYLAIVGISLAMALIGYVAHREIGWHFPKRSGGKSGAGQTSLANAIITGAVTLGFGLVATKAMPWRPSRRSK